MGDTSPHDEERVSTRHRFWRFWFSLFLSVLRSTDDPGAKKLTTYIQAHLFLVSHLFLLTPFSGMFPEGWGVGGVLMSCMAVVV